MLSDELVAKIASGLETMPPMPTSRHELQLLIAQIEAKIRAAQERGWTYVEIAKQISESGYPIKSSTLRAAIRRRVAQYIARTAGAHDEQPSRPKVPGR